MNDAPILAPGERREYTLLPVVVVRAGRPCSAAIFAKHEGGRFLVALLPSRALRYQWEWARVIAFQVACFEPEIRAIGWDMIGQDPPEYYAGDADAPAIDFSFPEPKLTDMKKA